MANLSLQAWRARRTRPLELGVEQRSGCSSPNIDMNYRQSRIDEMVLAFPGAGKFESGRVWKRIDFAVMDRLHEKGCITDPRGKQ